MRKGFTLIELMIVIAIIAIIAAIAIPNLLEARKNANQVSARAACGTVMTEVATAQTSIGRLPFFVDLGTFVDSGLYLSMAQNAVDSNSAGAPSSDANGTAPANDTVANAGTLLGSSYKAYTFSFLVDSAADAPDTTTRAIQACPKKYNKAAKNTYYRSNESGTTYQADPAFIGMAALGVGGVCTFFPTIVYNNNISSTWTTGN